MSARNNLVDDYERKLSDYAENLQIFEQRRVVVAKFVKHFFNFFTAERSKNANSVPK